MLIQFWHSTKVLPRRASLLWMFCLCFFPKITGTYPSTYLLPTPASKIRAVKISRTLCGRGPAIEAFCHVCPISKAWVKPGTLPPCGKVVGQLSPKIVPPLTFITEKLEHMIELFILPSSERQRLADCNQFLQTSVQMLINRSVLGICKIWGYDEEMAALRLKLIELNIS